jgi:hypothetical protein
MACTARLDFADIGGTVAKKNGFPLEPYAGGFDPVNLTRAGLVHLDVRVEHIHRLEVVGSGEEIDPGLGAFSFEDGRPLEGDGGLRVDLEN